MDFKDVIKQLSERVEKLKDNLQTEEATKTALIMPFIQALGYDVFNPLEVMPEFTCDIGTKKGEKIDYAIIKDSDPVILIECKHWAQDLNLHDNQLLRYFHVSKAKFGVLTNGIVFRFYTDLEAPNKMDEKPFLEFDILRISNIDIEELKKFHKTYFDLDSILSSASELKYTRELKLLLNQEFNNPSSDFVKLFARQVYNGMLTQKMMDQFSILVKKSISGIINDRISDRLNSAIQKEEKKDDIKDKGGEELEPLPGGVLFSNKESGITTTQQEIDAYNIVRSILRKDVDVSRLAYTDYKTYFVVVVDKPSKWICRFYFNWKTYISFPLIDEGKGEEKIEIKSIDDIFNYSDKLIEILKARL